MRFASLLYAGLWHHRRIHTAVALGVMVTSAVLTGALLVGDSGGVLIAGQCENPHCGSVGVGIRLGVGGKGWVGEW